MVRRQNRVAKGRLLAPDPHYPWSGREVWLKTGHPPGMQMTCPGDVTFPIKAFINPWSFPFPGVENNIPALDTNPSMRKP